MVGIQYQFGKEETIKLLNNILEALKDDQLILMDIELQSKMIITVDFHCYECGYTGTHTFTANEDVSEFCPDCGKVMNLCKI